MPADLPFPMSVQAILNHCRGGRGYLIEDDVKRLVSWIEGEPTRLAAARAEGVRELADRIKAILANDAECCGNPDMRDIYAYDDHGNAIDIIGAEPDGCCGCPVPRDPAAILAEIALTLSPPSEPTGGTAEPDICRGCDGSGEGVADTTCNRCDGSGAEPVQTDDGSQDVERLDISPETVAALLAEGRPAVAINRIKPSAPVAPDWPTRCAALEADGISARKRVAALEAGNAALKAENARLRADLQAFAARASDELLRRRDDIPRMSTPLQDGRRLGLESAARHIREMASAPVAEGE